MECLPHPPALLLSTNRQQCSLHSVWRFLFKLMQPPHSWIYKRLYSLFKLKNSPSGEAQSPKHLAHMNLWAHLGVLKQMKTYWQVAHWHMKDISVFLTQMWGWSGVRANKLLRPRPGNKSENADSPAARSQRRFHWGPSTLCQNTPLLFFIAASCVTFKVKVSLPNTVLGSGELHAVDCW